MFPSILPALWVITSSHNDIPCGELNIAPLNSVQLALKNTHQFYCKPLVLKGAYHNSVSLNI